MKAKKYIATNVFLVCIISCTNCAHLPPVASYTPYRDKPDYYDKAIHELDLIYEQDQKDRDGFSQFNTNDLLWIAKQDEQRRTKVADFFARGCLKSADDYRKAALIFQHGVVPEHFYQAFIWARTAVHLGDNGAQHLANLSVDRFLVNSGFKQLFGSQALKPSNSPCWCLYPIEPSFTDQDRTGRNAKTLAEQIEWLKTLNADAHCPDVYCAMELKSVAKKDFPEFW